MSDLVRSLRAMPHSRHCRIILWPRSAVSCNCHMVSVHKAADEIERLRAALERAYSAGHNYDCLFCGFKDKIITEAVCDD